MFDICNINRAILVLKNRTRKIDGQNILIFNEIRCAPGIFLSRPPGFSSVPRALARLCSPAPRASPTVRGGREDSDSIRNVGRRRGMSDTSPVGGKLKLHSGERVRGDFFGSMPPRRIPLCRCCSFRRSRAREKSGAGIAVPSAEKFASALFLASIYCNS